MFHDAIYVILIHELSLLMDLVQEGLVIVVFVSVIPREGKQLVLILTVEENGAVLKAEELLKLSLERAKHGLVSPLLANHAQEGYGVVPISHLVPDVPLEDETFYAQGEGDTHEEDGLLIAWHKVGVLSMTLTWVYVASYRCFLWRTHLII